MFAIFMSALNSTVTQMQNIFTNTSIAIQNTAAEAIISLLVVFVVEKLIDRTMMNHNGNNQKPAQ